MSTDTTSQAQPPEPPPPPPPEVTPANGSAPPATVAPADPPSTKPEATPPSDPRKPVPDPDIVSIPSYSRWFSWNGIHECEVRQMPEFFDEKSPSKNPRVYKYYRNAIINKFRVNPSRKITFTEVRRVIIGDVGSIRRVFDFLETWGLINYSPSAKPPLRWEERESKSSSSSATAPPTTPAATGDATDSRAVNGERSKKWCSGCKAVCTIACFVSDKYDLVLCARCYVRGNYRVGLSSTEFRRVEISEPVKTDWTDKETLHLLEAIMHYGDDWKRVAEHVGGRTEKECVARFIKLPFGEQLAELAGQAEEESTTHQTNAESRIEPPAKRMHLTPLADASNPIMAQAAFLSALAGVEVSEAAARAAVATLYDRDHLTSRGSVQSQVHSMGEQEPGVASNGGSLLRAPEEDRVDAESQLKQEEDEFVKSISFITEVQMKEILDKIGRYEQMDLQLEKEWHQLHQMKHQLFLDQLTLLFNKSAQPKYTENVAEENVRTELTPST